MATSSATCLTYLSHFCRIQSLKVWLSCCHSEQPLAFTNWLTFLTALHRWDPAQHHSPESPSFPTPTLILQLQAGGTSCSPMPSLGTCDLNLLHRISDFFLYAHASVHLILALVKYWALNLSLLSNSYFIESKHCENSSDLEFSSQNVLLLTARNHSLCWAEISPLPGAPNKIPSAHDAWKDVFKTLSELPGVKPTIRISF